MFSPSHSCSIPLRHSVGLDIANETFEASLGVERLGQGPKLSPSRSFPNQVQGYEQLVDWIEERGLDPSRCLFVMEATGVYYQALASWLYGQGYQVAVLFPNTVLAFAKSLNIKTKSDQVDAKVLAHMGCERYLKPWSPAPKALKELKQLTRHRERLIHHRTMAKNQLHADKKQVPPSQLVIQSGQAQIAFLSTQIKQIETHIQALIQADPTLKKLNQILTSIPTIGPVSAAVLLAETQAFQHFRNHKQLVSYAGYDVVKKQSGSSINTKGRISKKGNHRIRKTLFFPALQAPKRIEHFGNLYRRINQQNPNTKMKGAVAIQRKLLCLAFALCKKQQMFDPEYSKKKGVETINCGEVSTHEIRT